MRVPQDRKDGFPPRFSNAISAARRRWFELMLEQGYTAPTWPARYGGAGLTPDEARVLEAELVALKLPPPLVGFGLAMIGPTLLEFGTRGAEARAPAEDRARRDPLVPGLLGAGRRLGPRLPADARRARRRRLRRQRPEDLDVVRRQVGLDLLPRAHRSAGEEARRHHVPADRHGDPGVTVRPIQLISGASPFCETFFEDVRVPVANVVGEVNGGWTIAKALLGYERIMIADVVRRSAAASARQALVAQAREVLGAATGPLPDASLRAAITDYGMHERAYQLALARDPRSCQGGRAPGPESSIFKIYGTELNQRRHELACRIAGPQALGWEGPGFDADELDTDARLAALARQHDRGRHAPRSSSTSSPSACSACRTEPCARAHRRAGAPANDRGAPSSRERSPVARVRAAARRRRRPASRASSGARWPSSAGSASPFPESHGGQRARVLRAVRRARGSSAGRSTPEPFLSTVLLARPSAAARRQRARRSRRCLPGARAAAKSSRRRLPGARQPLRPPPRRDAREHRRARAGVSAARRLRCSTATSPTR